MWKRRKILICDHYQQKSEHGHGKRRTEPREPSAAGGGRRSCLRERRDCCRAFRKNYLAMGDELGCGANVAGALLAVEEVLFEFVPQGGIEFFEQILLRYFFANHHIVVHG